MYIHFVIPRVLLHTDMCIYTHTRTHTHTHTHTHAHTHTHTHARTRTHTHAHAHTHTHTHTRAPQEEFEDTVGNVVNRKTYEDLRRQGLL